MEHSLYQTGTQNKFDLPLESSPLSLKSRSLLLRLALTQRSLEAKTLKEMGIRSDQLILQRLERELAKKKEENENLLKKLKEAEKKISELLLNSEKLKNQAEEQISQLREKLEELQKNEKEREAEIAKLIVQMEDLNSSMLEFQKKSREEIKKAAQKGEVLTEIEGKFLETLKLFEEHLKKEEPPAPQNSAQIVATPSSKPEGSEINSSSEVKDVPAIEPNENFLQRFVRWWQEPVTTLHFSLFSKKSGK